jgi:hypothetical protein
MAYNRDVVVTGVSTGIGHATTKVLVARGFRVFGTVRKQADADRLQAEFGDGYVPLIMDISDADVVHQAAEQVGSMIGDRNLVGLVNNAGIVVSGPLLYMRPSEYRRQLEVNMISPLVVIQAFAPLLGTDKKRQGPTGRIVNMSTRNLLNFSIVTDVCLGLLTRLGEIGSNRRFGESLRGSRRVLEGCFRPSGGVQAHCSTGLACRPRAISLGSRMRLWAAQLKTNSQSTLCSPRSFTWRIGPVCLSHPNPFSTSHRRLMLMA